MRYLSVSEIIGLHGRVLDASGGASGIRDVGALKSAVAQPRLTFGGEELYPSLSHKAAALCHSLVLNHPFLDGNKRVAHAALETMLVLNGYELSCGVDEQEQLFLSLASGGVGRTELGEWVEGHLEPMESDE